MDIRIYTDNNYIPILDLHSLGNGYIKQIEEYRRSFMEIIPLDDLNFVNIVETPMLVKKRFIKNVEIKGFIDIKPKDNDYILEIAKLIALNKEIPGVDLQERETIFKKYIENHKDITIITNYLTNNIEKLISSKSKGNINNIAPELTKNDIQFIKNKNDVNLQYSLIEYQEIAQCSYETARQSLDKMTALELYKKNKVGKKYVFKPTNKLLDLLERIT